MTPTVVLRDGLLGTVVPVPRDVAALSAIIGEQRYAALRHDAETFRRRFAGSTIWNVNSTAAGGGVAEMLQTLVGYVQDLGVDIRWLVLHGDPAFFATTKRLHNALHGDGDVGAPDAAEAEHYRAVLAENAAELTTRVQPGDIVLLHDPQTAGLAPWLRRAGVPVVWRCHVGSDHRTATTRAAWAFLRQHLEGIDGFVFSRRRFVPPWMPADRTWIIPPSIDPFAPKNSDLDPSTVDAVLRAAGLVDGPAPATAPEFVGRDGQAAQVTRRAGVVGERLPGASDELVLQVSRWDRLKDMSGVLDAFARHVAPATEAMLALVGPAVTDVADDPEGAAVYQDCVRRWEALPADLRSRIVLVTLPLDDVDENAVMVNALQRHATAVVQKSLAEGFGLTVAEAMWKGRPVIGSAVGGITDQIVEGTGLLLPDPRDLVYFGGQVCRLLTDPALRDRLGAGAREHIRRNFVGDLHLRRYAELFSTVIGV